MEQLQEMFVAMLGPELGAAVAQLAGAVLADVNVARNVYATAGVWVAAAYGLKRLIEAYRSERVQLFAAQLAQRWSPARWLVWSNLPTPARWGVPLGLGAAWAVCTGVAGVMTWPGAIVTGLGLGLGAVFAHHGEELASTKLNPSRAAASISRPVSLVPRLDPSRIPTGDGP